MSECKHTKICAVCGKPFKAYPSDKTVTCSKTCSSIRRSQKLKGKAHKWSIEAKVRLKSKPGFIENFKNNVAPKGAKAAIALPESQRGPQNREAKLWIIKSPEGTVYEIVNLLDWARHNYYLFEPVTSDAEKSANRIRAGFAAIEKSRRNPKKYRSCTSYKGWTLLSVSEKPNDKNHNA